jgi:hypothetical protein
VEGLIPVEAAAVPSRCSLSQGKLHRWPRDTAHDLRLKLPMRQPMVKKGFTKGDSYNRIERPKTHQSKNH